jgi:hypothetical protein
LEYCDCPIQLNGYDCGLFAIGVVIHLVDGKNLMEQTFKQENITDLRRKMATFFGDNGIGELETTSQVVRGCFPQLRGSSILDSFGLEVVTRVPNKEAPVAKRDEDSSDGEVDGEVCFKIAHRKTYL